MEENKGNENGKTAVIYTDNMEKLISDQHNVIGFIENQILTSYMMVLQINCHCVMYKIPRVFKRR